MAQKHLLIICGEASGELHAANLSRQILKLNPQIKISGIGSDGLRASGVEVFYDIKGLAAIGLFDVLKKLPQFFALKKLILEKIKQTLPDAVIFVDFSGFNLRLAKAINHRIPAIYYVSPQVWASRSGRIRTIKKYISKMLVLFEFEKEFYKRHGVEVDFLGHPLLDIARPSTEKNVFLRQEQLSEIKTTLALLPGSRRQEVEKILPVMLEASKLIGKNISGLQIIIAKSPNVDREIYQRLTRSLNLELKIIEGKTYDCLNCADFSLVASGTATLEAAIIGKPFVVIYKMGWLNYLLYSPQVKVPYIGMVNIVAGKKIVPEFIQSQAQPQAICQQVLAILNNPSLKQEMLSGLSRVKSLLGEPGAGLRAAQAILAFLN